VIAILVRVPNLSEQFKTRSAGLFFMGSEKKGFIPVEARNYMGKSRKHLGRMAKSVTLPPAAVPTRGKCMSRRSGQNPSVRKGTRADGSKYYFFQYEVDVPGQEQRKRMTEVLGVVGKMTPSEAEMKKTNLILKLGLTSSEQRIPSSKTFADCVKHYRVWAPVNLSPSTVSVANIYLKVHLEPYWKDVPIEHIDLDEVTKWAWKKRPELSWVTIMNMLRTLHRVISCVPKTIPPFSLKNFPIPKKDKVRMERHSRNAVKFSWAQANQIADAVQKLDGLDDDRKSRYATLFLLASATGLRCSELYALRMGDVDFKAHTIRVDESFDGLTYQIGQCKNSKAYRTVFLGDAEGRKSLRILKAYVGDRVQNRSEFLFHSKRGTPLLSSNVLSEALHPALEALGFPKAGMHAFRRGCNVRWELSGMNGAVLRPMMGHSSASMTSRYSGEISIDQIRADFSRRNGPKIVVSENSENASAVQAIA
jgi:integrase